MEIALIICDNEQEVADATGYLKGVGATVERQDNCTDLSVHEVEGQAPNATFPSQYHKMGKFTLLIGKWA